MIKTREEGVTMRKRRKKMGGKMKGGEEKRKETGERKLVPNFSLSVLGSSTGTTSFRLLIALILQQTNVKLAVTQFVTETGFY